MNKINWKSYDYTFKLLLIEFCNRILIKSS
jgi:hypothetical protein